MNKSMVNKGNFDPAINLIHVLYLNTTHIFSLSSIIWLKMQIKQYHLPPQNPPTLLPPYPPSKYPFPSLFPNFLFPIKESLFMFPPF